MSAQTEHGYHGLQAGAEPQAWKSMEADIDETHVYIDGHPVMEGWEKPYQDAIAKIACENGGKVLEVGFGMALSASAIQRNDIGEHVIIEASEAVFKRLESWAAQQKHKVTPMFGLWQDVVKTLPSNSFDGIYYDTYPNNKESQHTHQFEFLKEARRILKPGGILTYCNLTSLGVLRPEFSSEGTTDKEAWERLFLETQKPHILKAGWEESEIKQNEIFGPLSPPKECEYYQHSSLLMPRLVKTATSAP
eukprot:TRINITY_DN1157_c0_g1_i1.p1 TRINITY_DN1157_c0_g1~~TRINITY_DN1157_c0_g1_i1.p1  ORF type:complete len:249 (+),score=92.81 TRINITY_DN1157_c0_g1_i1:76-822(+)